MTSHRALLYGAPVLGVWLLSIAFGGTASPEAAPYADGAPPGFTGGFKEQACDACHFEAAVNVKPGQLTIDGVPERYAVGERYELTVTLARPDMKIAGFQLAARFEATGAQAGTLAVRPADTEQIKVETSGGVQYANQLKAGTALTTPGTARWTLVWTAPAPSGPVVFHASANAANDDEFAGGDYVYTAVARSQAAAANASDAFSIKPRADAGAVGPMAHRRRTPTAPPGSRSDFRSTCARRTTVAPVATAARQGRCSEAAPSNTTRPPTIVIVGLMRLISATGIVM